MTTAAAAETAPKPEPREAESAAPAKESIASRIGRYAGGGAVRAFLVIVAFLWLTPAVGLLLSSFRDPADIATTGWWKVFGDPGQLTTDTYDALFGNEDVMGALPTTIWITVPSTVLVVLIGALAGYAFAWMDFPGRDWVFLAVVGLLVVPVQVALIPIASLYKDLNLFHTITGVVLFHVAFGLPFAIFLLRNFFAEIPRELLEAARIDGASELRLFFRVVMPLGGPAIAALSIFQFLWVWNDMLVALVFADPGKPPLTVAVQQQTRQFDSNIELIASGAFISMIIPLVVFFAFQRQFVSGVMAGAVK